MTSETNGPRFLYKYVLALVIPTLVCLVVVTADLILHPIDVDTSGSAIVRLFSGGIVAPATLLVALLIIRRVPNNVIGLLLILWAVNIAIRGLRTSLIAPDTWLPDALFSELGWYSLLIIAVYFPTGRAYWPRYERWIELLCVSVLSVNIIIGLPIFAPIQPIMRNFGVINIILMILAIVSLFLRYRTSGSRERQQMKWLVWGFMIFLMTAIPFKIILWTTTSIDNYANEIYGRIIFIFPVIAIGGAILRHKLYDIDIIIRRTLVYSILTTILAAIYFMGIVLTQQVFRAVTGENSDLAIVISTLMIAALFSPIRHRVQNVIDRRLYRRKYNVEQTLAQFQQNLRDDVDIETLKANLLSVISDTMQPEKIALWVKPSAKM
ncbi:MAG: diguanylate cyclase and metal dependent phosphohydrolase [Chloroflexi bacterium OLB15]|nr:MAG: diguanylate cyclase and metal dependent phosphohydrolase [Chloroflexi bacterium OLB15]